MSKLLQITLLIVLGHQTINDPSWHSLQLNCYISVFHHLQDIAPKALKHIVNSCFILVILLRLADLDDTTLVSGLVGN